MCVFKHLSIRVYHAWYGTHGREHSFLKIPYKIFQENSVHIHIVITDTHSDSHSDTHSVTHSNTHSDTTEMPTGGELLIILS